MRIKNINRRSFIKSFRNKKIQILIATDVLARGLDVPSIEYVINYDLPQCPEDYVHRIGRTGRVDSKGVAINLITNKDKRKWGLINNYINPDKKEKDHKNNGSSNRSSNSKKRRSNRNNSQKKSFNQKPKGKNFGKKDFFKKGKKSSFKKKAS